MTRLILIIAAEWAKEFELFGKPDDGAPAWNVYIYGFPGSTKSSFINTITTILEPSSSIKTIAPVGAGDEHCTRRLMRYEVANNINLWDTWGLNKQSYHPKLIQQFNQGFIPKNYNMTDMSFKSAAGMSQYSHAAPMRKAHSIIFFIPWGSLSDSEELELTKACFREFKGIESEINAVNS